MKKDVLEMDNLKRAKIGQYLHTKDGRYIVVRDIIVPGHLYIGTDIEQREALVEICQSDILDVVDEVCKGIVVE